MFCSKPRGKPLFILALSCAVTLAGCRTGPDEPAPAPQAATSRTPIDPVTAPGETYYEIDGQRTRALILVRRTGALSRFGHDHVIAATPVHGFVIWSGNTPGASRASLRVDVESLVVDAPELRQRFRLDTNPDDEDITGTRANMMEHVLRPGKWPVVLMDLRFGCCAPPAVTAVAELTINGVRRNLEIPTMIEIEDHRLRAHGQFRLRQSDWGIEPFSILGGGLRVADELEVHFELEAKAAPGSGE